VIVLPADMPLSHRQWLDPMKGNREGNVVRRSPIMIVAESPNEESR
jgi:hypothetical protein